MKQIQNSTEIKAPVGDVFASLADPLIQMKYDGEMMRSCEKLSSGPIGKGTHFRGDFKGMGKIEYEYSEFGQNRLIEHSVKMPFGFMRHRFVFEPANSGSRLTQSIIIELNVIGKILWPLMMKSMMVKRMRKLNGLLRNYLEHSK